MNQSESDAADEYSVVDSFLGVFQLISSSVLIVDGDSADDAFDNLTPDRFELTDAENNIEFSHDVIARQDNSMGLSRRRYKHPETPRFDRNKNDHLFRPIGGSNSEDESEILRAEIFMLSTPITAMYYESAYFAIAESRSQCYPDMLNYCSSVPDHDNNKGDSSLEDINPLNEYRYDARVVPIGWGDAADNCLYNNWRILSEPCRAAIEEVKLLRKEIFDDQYRFNWFLSSNAICSFLLLIACLVIFPLIILHKRRQLQLSKIDSMMRERPGHSSSINIMPSGDVSIEALYESKNSCGVLERFVVGMLCLLIAGCSAAIAYVTLVSLLLSALNPIGSTSFPASNPTEIITNILLPFIPIICLLLPVITLLYVVRVLHFDRPAELSRDIRPSRRPQISTHVCAHVSRGGPPLSGPIYPRLEQVV